MAKKKAPGDTAKAKSSAKRAPDAAPVEAVKHQDRRTNIPTREQGAMVATDEAAPRSVLYPRDPSLDPQLVWKGKDEQDRHPLEVPAVNAEGRFGRWDFLEITDPWDAQNVLRRFLASHRAGG